jgi:ABC-type nickel/cobalt efflux system permease component RcnA
MLSLQVIVGIIVGIVAYTITFVSFAVVVSFLAWMLVDAAKQDRFWWIVIMLGVPIIGPAVYYLTEKKHEYAKAPSHHIHDSETESQHETSHKHHRKDDVIEESREKIILAEKVEKIEDVPSKKVDHKEEK